MSLKESLHIQTRRSGITLFGEILMDEIYNQLTNETIRVFGGSPANISVNITELGFPNTMFFGSVGNDEYGKTLVDYLESKHVNTRFINQLELPTSVVRINRTEHSPIPEFFRAADFQLQYTEELDAAIKNSSIFHFTFWPLTREPAKSTLLKALKVAKENQTIVGFDPNYHHLLVTTESLPLEELPELLQYVDIIKPSLDDSVRIFGEGLSVEAYLQKYVEYGVKLVIMTLGKDGLVAYINGQTYYKKSLATQVVDATGAGDAFLSGLYASILQGENIDTALSIGSACSALNLTKIGALSDLPNLETLKKQFHIGVE